MKIKGDILLIRNKRDSKHQDITIEINQVAYITHKKDGRYFQPFETVADLESPLFITGDLLARVENKSLAEGEHEFKVYDKIEDAYTLNPNKHLLVTIEFDFDTAEAILTSVEYTVTVSSEEFKQLQSQKISNKELPKGKNSRKK